MNKKSDAKPNSRAFENPLELMLNTAPDVLSPLIKTTVSECKSGGLNYWSAEEEASASLSFRKILVAVYNIEGDSISFGDCVGIVTLQSLVGGKTLFRIPPRSQWHINVEPTSLDFLPEIEGRRNGHVSNDEFYWHCSEKDFQYFLEKLLKEFKRLGFIALPAEEEKPPIGFPIPHKRGNS